MGGLIITKSDRQKGGGGVVREGVGLNRVFTVNRLLVTFRQFWEMRPSEQDHATDDFGCSVKKIVAIFLDHHTAVQKMKGREL